jgi:hypothetical protein
MLNKFLVAAVAAMIFSTAVSADQQEELLKLRNTTLNLIEALVKEGILSRERAEQLIAEAEQSADQEIRQQEALEATTPADVVRVPYVPEFVREEIRDEVRAELKDEVVEEVMVQAREEEWGIPGALPDWVDRFRFSGDIRLRAESDMYSSNNVQNTFVDYNEVNENGGFSGSFLNTTKDRDRYRLRMRLGVDAAVNDNLLAGIRISTGTPGNPVSTNETMDNYFGSTDVVLDRAYLKYSAVDDSDFQWLTAWGGRMPNPWFSTDLVWDHDLNFDGAAATYRYNLSGAEDSFWPDAESAELFVTLGGFSLDEDEWTSSADKWLLAGQVGSEIPIGTDSRLKLGLAYYDYQNITGKRSPLSQPNKYDATAPEFVQKGNSMFVISNNPANPFEQFGLAPEYEIINLTAEYDINRFAPYVVTLTGDYAENIGYDAGDIRDRLAGGGFFVNSTPFTGDPDDEETTGYMAKVMFGWPDVLKRHRWQAYLTYKHLERDAVLDAFTDSDFHLGGTNAEGWIIGGSYGLAENTWLTLRYLTADEIVGPPLGIDVLQIDLNAKF